MTPPEDDVRPPAAARQWGLTALLAAAVFALTFFSPVDEADADPAVALLVSQSILDHGTLRLDAYRQHAALAYDLESDYRIHRRDGSYYYYANAVPLLSLPFVWLANLTGRHMLDQGAELALQNLLSAVTCALIAVLLFRISRAFLSPVASLAVAAVSTLGSSLVSSLGSGLWNANYEVLLLAIALLHLVQRDRRSRPPNLVYLACLSALAFWCRPTAAFAIAAGALVLFPTVRSRRRRTLLLVGSAALLTVYATISALEIVPRYYSLLKLTPSEPFWIGVYGLILSPSRGLAVFSPFLALVAVGSLRFFADLFREPLFRLALWWSVLQLAATATKAAWWGGHCFGPRLLTELTLPAIVASCLLWNVLVRRWSEPARRVAATGYFTLGLVAVFIHSGQGLFNEHTRRWNETPNIDAVPTAIFDWRHPQFLATEASLEERSLALQRRTAGSYEFGAELAFDSRDALFRSWYPVESGWRWSRGSSPEILLHLGSVIEGELHVLRLLAGALARQKIALEVNGVPISSVQVEGQRPRWSVFAFESGLLVPGAENRFRFNVSSPATTDEDDRLLGIALHALRLGPLDETFPGVAFDDASFFEAGFSDAEAEWRWTDGHRAVLGYPIAEIDRIDTLEIEAHVLEPQSIRAQLNGIHIGQLVFDTRQRKTLRLSFDPALLRPRRINHIELTLAKARRVGDDPRLLGLAFVELRLSSSLPAARGTP